MGREMARQKETGPQDVRAILRATEIWLNPDQGASGDGMEFDACGSYDDGFGDGDGDGHGDAFYGSGEGDGCGYGRAGMGEGYCADSLVIPILFANEADRRTERVFRCAGCIGRYECSIHGRRL